MDVNGGETTQRTLEQISSILTHAKLKEEDFLPTTQVLYINGENAKTDKYKLLELDDHLSESLKCNDTVVFKGDEDDENDIVLCTETRTYDVRECETSNSLLMIPNLQLKTELKSSPGKTVNNKHVVGISYKYFEVTPAKPQLDAIIKLLESTMYKGPEKEYEYESSQFANAGLVTFEELLSISQSSRKELEMLLNKLDTVTIKGKIRMLELDYHFRVLSFLLKSAEENSWALDEIHKEESINAWSEIVPKEVLEKLFDMYTEKSKVVNDEQLFKYIELKVCQFFARVLLQYAGKFNLNDFLQAWKESVPEGMIAKEEMLGGLAIIDRVTKPNVIWAFPESKLPDTITERFELLFKTKPKWAVAEITPYIQSLTTDKMDANALLAKYARASNENGVRYYCAKHNN